MSSSFSPVAYLPLPKKLPSLDYLLDGFWREHGDPRSADYPFMSSVRVPGTVLTAYLLFVLWIGPWWMARRERAFSLKPLLLVYNLALAAYNGYVFARLLLNPGHLVERVLDTRYPPVEDRSEWTLAVIDDIYIYIISKYVDLLDTVFFVLRKKQSQVTALHLYHHFMVAANGWVIFRLCALCNVCSLFVLLNSGIHLLMYR